MVRPSENDLASVIHTSKKGIVLDIEVSPGSKKVGLSSINPWRKTLGLSVKAAPKKGEANKDVLDLLARVFGISSANITILSGATSSTKRIEVQGVTKEEAKKAIFAAFGVE